MRDWATEEVPVVYLTALCAWREARGASEDAILGVLHVIRNRAMKPSWWGHGYVGVVLHASQFSCFNANDPQVGKFPPPDDPAFARILELTAGVITGDIPDNTNAATHYHDKSVSPHWAASLTFAGQIGPFSFYR